RSAITPVDAAVPLLVLSSMPSAPPPLNTTSAAAQGTITRPGSPGIRWLINEGWTWTVPPEVPSERQSRAPDMKYRPLGVAVNSLQAPMVLSRAVPAAVPSAVHNPLGPLNHTLPACETSSPTGPWFCTCTVPATEPS